MAETTQNQIVEFDPSMRRKGGAFIGIAAFAALRTPGLDIKDKSDANKAKVKAACKLVRAEYNGLITQYRQSGNVLGALVAADPTMEVKSWKSWLTKSGSRRTRLIYGEVTTASLQQQLDAARREIEALKAHKSA